MKKRPQTEAQARKNMIMYLKNVAGFRLDYFKGMSYDDIHKRRKLNEEVEDLKRHLEIVPDEDDDVYTEATPLARKVPVVDYEIIHLNNKPHYKIIRADGTHQLYLILLVEWRYPLSRFTLDQMLNAARLRVEEQSEMSLELLRDYSVQQSPYSKAEDPISEFSTSGIRACKIIEISDKLADKVNLIYNYKLALAQVESRLVEYKEREVKYIEKIRTLEYYDKGKMECIETLKKELETLKQEKDVVDGKLTSLLKSSKDLENLIESQRSDKIKDGLGYSAVPPLIAQLYISPKKDLSWTGLSECADDTVTDYSRPSPTVESTSGDDQNKNSSAFENGESTYSILSKPAVKFVKVAERSTSNKVEAVKKPSLGENFVRKNRACFNCGHVDHLSYDCGLGVKKGTTKPQNNTHISMPPRPAIHRPYRPLIRQVRPNMNAARPKRISFYKPGHSYNKRPFQETTQDLVAILIQRVRRLERELKARTPIHKDKIKRLSEDKKKQRNKKLKDSEAEYQV
nr:hypothetical protein [Tanacetum cinerariifolium]